MKKYLIDRWYCFVAIVIVATFGIILCAPVNAVELNKIKDQLQPDQVNALVTTNSSISDRLKRESEKTVQGGHFLTYKMMNDGGGTVENRKRINTADQHKDRLCVILTKIGRTVGSAAVPVLTSMIGIEGPWLSPVAQMGNNLLWDWFEARC